MLDYFYVENFKESFGMSIIFTGGSYPDKSFVVFKFCDNQILKLVCNTPIVTEPY